MSDALDLLVKAHPEAIAHLFSFLKDCGKRPDPKTRNLISVPGGATRVECGGCGLFVRHAEMDAPGEEVVRHLVEGLRSSGIAVAFSGLKKQVLDVMHATGLFEVISAENIFPNEDQALAAIYRGLGREGQGELQQAAKASAGVP